MPLLSGSRRARRFFDRLAPLYDRINARIYKPDWLARVRGAAEAGENVMPAVVEAVKGYATVGEMVATLKRRWGEFLGPVRL